MLSASAAAAKGPRSCRSTIPCPTMTSRPPTGRAAALQHGHVAGRASAHVGIRAIQDLIPSALATNLSVLRVCSIGREARRRGAWPSKARPSPSLSPPCPALYKRRDPMAIMPGSPLDPGGASGYRLATIAITTSTGARARER
jgi:hypothetical protein